MAPTAKDSTRMAAACTSRVWPTPMARRAKTWLGGLTRPLDQDTARTCKTFSRRGPKGGKHGSSPDQDRDTRPRSPDDVVLVRDPADGAVRRSSDHARRMTDPVVGGSGGRSPRRRTPHRPAAAAGPLAMASGPT